MSCLIAIVRGVETRHGQMMSHKEKISVAWLTESHAKSHVKGEFKIAMLKWFSFFLLCLCQRGVLNFTTVSYIFDKVMIWVIDIHKSELYMQDVLRFILKHWPAQHFISYGGICINVYSIFGLDTIGLFYVNISTSKIYTWFMIESAISLKFSTGDFTTCFCDFPVRCPLSDVQIAL